MYATAQFVPHFGYNSLFPFALQLLLPGSTEFGTMLEQLERKDLLWTQYGLRSLAKSSSIYMKHNTAQDAPYWRGAIWINVNFLTLRSLHACSQCAPPAHTLVCQMSA